MMRSDIYHRDNSRDLHHILCHMVETIAFFNFKEYQKNPKRVIADLVEHERITLNISLVCCGILRTCHLMEVCPSRIYEYRKSLTSAEPSWLSGLMKHHIKKCDHCSKVRKMDEREFTIGMGVDARQRIDVLRQFRGYLLSMKAFPLFSCNATDDPKESTSYWFDHLQVLEARECHEFASNMYKSVSYVVACRVLRKNRPVPRLHRGCPYGYKNVFCKLMYVREGEQDDQGSQKGQGGPESQERPGGQEAPDGPEGQERPDDQEGPEGQEGQFSEYRSCINRPPTPYPRLCKIDGAMESLSEDEDTTEC